MKDISQIGIFGPDSILHQKYGIFHVALITIDYFVCHLFGTIRTYHYHISIGLSILAYEEISKMQMFFMARLKKKGISKEDCDLVMLPDEDGDYVCPECEEYIEGEDEE